MDNAVKCADCGCYPEDCEHSNSPQTCSSCSWKECCCWTYLHENKSQVTSSSSAD